MLDETFWNQHNTDMASKRISNVIGAVSVFPDKDFPLSVLRQPRHSPSSLHRHEFHELVVILSGSGRHKTAHGNYSLEAGDVFLLSRETAHGYENPKNLALVNILFDPQRLRLPLADVGNIPGYQALFHVEPKLRSTENLRGRLRLTAAELAEAARLIARLQAEISKAQPGYRFAACACLMDLILYLSRCYTNERAPESGAILRIGDVLSFIEKHYAEPMRVPHLAQLAHMSESSLMRTFRQVMGTSPVDHVIRVRIGRASDMLRHHDLRITEVAYQCGFRDSNYFARQFRKVTGRTPRQFRRLARE